jgi:hypothetical protein
MFVVVATATTTTKATARAGNAECRAMFVAAARQQQ